MITLDMKGKACPIPVIETKKALNNNSDTICTIVDNSIAVENIIKMAKDINANVEVNTVSETLHYIYTSLDTDIVINPVSFKNTLVINSEFMGEDPVIGANLIQACIHTLSDLDTIPKQIIFYNSAVKLFEKSEHIYNDLTHLHSLGVELISCGACINHYGITKNIGRTTNMYEIMQILTSDSKIVYI